MILHGLFKNRRTSALVIAIVSLAFVTCGDDDSAARTTRIAFPPDRADHLAHAALPRVDELPGTGWEVTERDEFSDNSTDREESEAFLEAEPSCRAIAELPGFFGKEEDDTPPVAQAQVQLSRPGRGLVALPSSVEVGLEVAATAVEVQGTWGIVKTLFESDDWPRCFAKAVERQTAAAGTTGGVKISIEPKPPSATPPRDGVAFAVDVSMQASIIKINMSLEMYFWPYSNSQVTVMFSSAHEDLSADDIDRILKVVDNAVRTADDREPEPLPGSVALPAR